VAVTEQARHHLHTYFAEAMGDERAATMMELLPPTGWGDLATRQDLEHVRLDLGKDIAHLTAMTQKEFAGLRNALKGDLDRALRVHTLATVTVFMAMPAAMTALTQLF
jgi:hypothetical protein